MAEHKIQSREFSQDGVLELKLLPTPKKLGLVKKWCPNTYCVSFKVRL